MKVRDGAIVPHDGDIDFSGLYDKESLDDFWANDFDKFAAALRQLGLQAHRSESSCDPDRVHPQGFILSLFFFF